MMQGAWPHAGDARGIFLELFGFGTATQKAPSACDFFERFFKKWRKNAETKGSCRGYSHMQGTPGEYFQNCLYFVQPLKRQPPYYGYWIFLIFSFPLFAR